ncbi:MAG: molecular chaperone DnaJ [Phenylobacterium sp.]|uniref:molecular chaperone DnaJ n=1 Tax=Phenylobacterium sp. TaxID=1871053 RepID=UPI002A371E01|nr:molecular chaperone DnaJ [Phenylobacterium sp.]MDX9996652.1 molecular chaperone DnaJ [Phenylobacterium sp.]
MIYLAIGTAALALILWLSRGRPILKRSEWRIAAAAFALAAFAGAAYVGLRGGWGSSIVLLVVGLWLLASARRTGLGPGPAAKDSARMSESEARSILGVGPEATPAEILAAHKRLMGMAHPDKGGTSGLAAQLNAARDRLLRK